MNSISLCDENQGGLKAAKSNKKQRPRSAGHPYGRNDDQTCNDGTFMKNFNDVVCQSMYQVINPHAEAELPSSSQMEVEDDLLSNHIDPNATTPPCLLNTSDPGNVQIIPTLFSNNQATNNYASSPSNDNAPTSTTVDMEKPNSKLADFRVQDLKNECKKRQIPVSGTKPQLLERLKPYEDEILASYAAEDGEVQEDNDSVDSTIARVAHSHDLAPTTIVRQCCGNSNCSENNVYFQQQHVDVKQPTMRDVINNYLENPNQPLSTIAQNCQRDAIKPQPPQLVLHIPQSTIQPQQQQQQQVVQLVDSTGAVIGVATVMNPNPTTPQTAPCCGCMQAQGGPLADRRRVALPTLAETRVENTGIALASSQTLNFGHTGANMIPSANIPSQSTFSFAQLGSGGEFTLVQSTPLNEPSCQGCAASSYLPKKCSLPNPIHVVTKSTPPSCHACHVSTQEPIRYVQSEEKSLPIATQRISEDCCSKPQDVPAPLVRRRSLPSLISDQSKPKEEEVPKPRTEPKETQEESKESDEADENIDTSTLFTAETMSMHEEMLRFQHKKIEELQEELRSSQNQLRQQQQMILKAKRAQMRQETEEGRIQSPTEAWLKDLDIKHLNKMHIQHFLHLKLQQQKMQNQMLEYQKLSTAEQILQEELHIEQAVKDIVRLIKQDARTSLLIVQLLRRYQLERCQQIQLERSQAIQPENDQQQDCDSSHSTGNQQPGTNAMPVGNCTSSCCQPINPSTVPNEDNDIIEIPRAENDATLNEPAEAKVEKEEAKVVKSPKKKVVKPKPEGNKTEGTLPEETPTSTDEAKKATSSSIDMEEIFKNVLEGASRVLRGEDPFDSSKPPSKKKKKPCPPVESEPKPPAPVQTKPPSKKSKPKPKPVVEEVQMSEPSMMVFSEDGGLEEGFPEDMHFVTGDGFQEVANFNKLPSCSQLLQPVRDLETSAFLQNSDQYQQFASINIDCSGKIDYSAMTNTASFNSHQIMDSFANEPCQATIYFNNQENMEHVDIDDLLDVLRDDQENPTRSSSQNEHTLDYTNDELVNFLSVDWNQNSNDKSQPMSVPPYNFIHSTKSNMSAMDGFSLDSDSHQGSVATIISSESMSDSTETDFMQQSMDQFNMPQISNQMLTLPNGNVCLQNNPIFSPMPQQQQESVDNMDWWDPMQNPLMITPDAHSMQLSVNSIQETGFQPMDALV